MMPSSVSCYAHIARQELLTDTGRDSDYKQAMNVKNAPPTPMEDLKSLDKTFQKRLEEHVRARKSLGA